MILLIVMVTARDNRDDDDGDCGDQVGDGNDTDTHDDGMEQS